MKILFCGTQILFLLCLSTTTFGQPPQNFMSFKKYVHYSVESSSNEEAGDKLEVTLTGQDFSWPDEQKIVTILVPYGIRLEKYEGKKIVISKPDGEGLIDYPFVRKIVRKCFPKKIPIQVDNIDIEDTDVIYYGPWEYRKQCPMCRVTMKIEPYTVTIKYDQGMVKVSVSEFNEDEIIDAYFFFLPNKKIHSACWIYPGSRCGNDYPGQPKKKKNYVRILLKYFNDLPDEYWNLFPKLTSITSSLDSWGKVKRSNKKNFQCVTGW